MYIYIYYKFTRHASTSDPPFPKRGNQGPETSLAPSADKQTGEGDINGATGVLRESPKCSNCER